MRKFWVGWTSFEQLLFLLFGLPILIIGIMLTIGIIMGIITISWAIVAYFVAQFFPFIAFDTEAHWIISTIIWLLIGGYMVCILASKKCSNKLIEKGLYNSGNKLLITFNLIKEILFNPRKALKKVLRIDTKLAYWLVPVLAVILTFFNFVTDPVWANDLAVLYLDKVLTNSLIITFFTYLTAMIYLLISKLAKVKKVLFEDCLKIMLACTLPSLLLLPFVLLENIALIWTIILTLLMFSEFTKFSKLKTFFWYIILPVLVGVLIGILIYLFRI